MDVYRITKRSHAGDLSGMGAMLHGGRWNTSGRPLIYSATTVSLALLESLAHSSVVAPDMVLMTIRLPPGMRIPKLAIKDLPVGWDTSPASLISQQFGDELLYQVLAVQLPSVIVPAESIVLINPLHSAIAKVRVVNVSEMPIDPRLK